MIVPNECIPLLREQRTHMGDISEYGIELEQTYQSFAQYLPRKATNILDIGCGMSGIDVFLSKHYDHDVKITLADKDGISEKIICGFVKSKDDFCHYHNFEYAIALLCENGVPRKKIDPIDLNLYQFPKEPFDVVISLLSWGFHYPISDYTPNVRPGGVIIADCRKKTSSEDALKSLGECRRIFDAQKYYRVLCKV